LCRKRRVPEASFAMASTTPAQESDVDTGAELAGRHFPRMPERLTIDCNTRNLRRSCQTQRRGAEQICHRPGKADRLEYRRSMARARSPNATGLSCRIKLLEWFDLLWAI